MENEEKQASTPEVVTPRRGRPPADAKPKPKPKPEAAESSEMFALIASLKKDIQSMKDQMEEKSGRTVRKHTSEHEAYMREFTVTDAEDDDKVVGVIVDVFNVREVSDPEHQNRVKGVCKVRVLDPDTGVETVYSKVDYLELLQNAHRIPVKILQTFKRERPEVDPRRGGGGYGTIRHKDPRTGLETHVELNAPFAVVYVDTEYDIEIHDGKYEGKKIHLKNANGLNL